MPSLANPLEKSDRSGRALKARFAELIEKMRQSCPAGDAELLNRAYEFAAEQYRSQLRRSGDPFLSHPLEVAHILADMKLDVTTVCAALLHDVVEDTRIPLETIAQRFGEDTARLVEGVTKISRLDLLAPEVRQAENVRKVLLAMVNVDLYPVAVYTFTPNGRVLVLPRGATPVDFAYAVHTEVGHQCVGAKVNGQIVPLRYPLSNGDVVEILTQKGHAPSRDWLSFVRTSRARSKIRHWINLHERTQASATERLLEEIRRMAERLGEPDLRLSREEVRNELQEAGIDLDEVKERFHEAAERIAERERLANRSVPLLLKQAIDSTRPPDQMPTNETAALNPVECDVDSAELVATEFDDVC